MTSVFDPEPVRSGRPLGKKALNFGRFFDHCGCRESGWRRQRREGPAESSRGIGPHPSDSSPFAEAQGKGTQEPRSRVRGRVVRGRLPPASFSADPKPNSHHNNDRKLEAGIQGCEAVNFCATVFGSGVSQKPKTRNCGFYG